MKRRNLAAALAAAPLAARAQTAPWRPDKPIRLVVGFAAGGSTDISGRLVAEGIAPILGQPVVVENRVGAGGNLGSELVARSAPDGSTFVVASVGTHATNQFLYRNMGFHVVNDFTPVSLVLGGGAVLCVDPRLPVRNIREFIDYAKARPGQLNMGTSGPGGTQHFAGALFEDLAGVRFTHIPYRGGAPAMADLIAGQVQVVFAPLAEAIGPIRGEQVRPLGASRLQPMPALPDLPPIASAVPGYEFNSWIGIFGPARLPQPIVQAVSGAIAQAVREPTLRRRMEQQGYLPIGGSAEDMAKAQRDDVALMERLVRQTGATAE